MVQNCSRLAAIGINLDSPTASTMKEKKGQLRNGEFPVIILIWLLFKPTEEFETYLKALEESLFRRQNKQFEISIESPKNSNPVTLIDGVTEILGEVYNLALCGLTLALLSPGSTRIGDQHDFRYRECRPPNPRFCVLDEESENDNT